MEQEAGYGAAYGRADEHHQRPRGQSRRARIVWLREQRVVVDADLAALYGVPTKRFNEAVKRNLAKFPAGFMFTLTDEEFAALRSQIATSNDGAEGRGGRRYLPRVFTEHGALMAATILNSPRAVEVDLRRACLQLMAPPDPPKRPIGFVTPAVKPPRPPSRSRR